MPVWRSAIARMRASASAADDVRASSTTKSLPRPCILVKRNPTGAPAQPLTAEAGAMDVAAPAGFAVEVAGAGVEAAEAGAGLVGKASGPFCPQPASDPKASNSSEMETVRRRMHAARQESGVSIDARPTVPKDTYGNVASVRDATHCTVQWPALDAGAGAAGFAAALDAGAFKSLRSPIVTVPRQRASRAAKYFLGSQRHGLQKSVLPQPATGASPTVGPPQLELTPAVWMPLSKPSREPVPSVLARFSAVIIRFFATASPYSGISLSSTATAWSCCAGVSASHTRSRVAMKLGYLRSAAKASHAHAVTGSFSTPRPLSYIRPMLSCDSLSA